MERTCQVEVCFGCVIETFYQPDAMLAQVLAMVLRLCLSQVGVLSKRMDGLSSFFGMQTSFDQSYTVL